jgi:hypothetical protein
MVQTAQMWMLFLGIELQINSVACWSILYRYITMHGPYYTDTSRCTVHIIQIYYGARSISYRYITMHIP